MKKIIIALVIVAVAVFAFFFFKKTPTVRAPAEEKVNQTPPVQNEVKEEAKTEPTSTPPATEEPKPIDLSQYKTPIMLVDQKKSYTAKMKTTAGEMDIELNVKDTPITANNFVFLAKKNFYDNVIFHRIIKGFMIQGGDPTGTGSGGPGYKFDDEPFKGEYLKGTIAMANSGPNTNGSQFFIMHDDYPLPPQYVIFGKVIKGLGVVDKIAEAKTTLGGDGAMSKPVEPVKILSVEIIEK
jgi:cyclophilin family peptidyl-prolyl cis-trans isomerase